MWCGLCKEGYGPDSRFCGECGSILEDNMPQKKDQGVLRDPEQLAKELYSYWTETLKTDGFEEDIDDWDTLDGNHRRNFIEAVNEIVVRPLDRVISDLEVEVSIAETSAALDRLSESIGPVATGPTAPPKQYKCYTCARNPVNQPGGVCQACKRIVP